MSSQVQRPNHYRWCCRCKQDKTTKGGTMKPLFKCADCRKTKETT